MQGSDERGANARESGGHDALVDLAVNRAAAYAARLGALGGEPATIRRRLELWYLRTRFAYRVPLERVVAALADHPGGDAHWAGGAAGGWRPGPPPRP